MIEYDEPKIYHSRHGFRIYIRKSEEYMKLVYITKDGEEVHCKQETAIARYSMTREEADAAIAIYKGAGWDDH
jgi:hypothetical protein